MSRPVTKGAIGVELESRTIQSVAKIKPVPEINYSWTPQLIAYTFQVNGNIYPYGINVPQQGAPAQPPIYRTAGLQELTFTADVKTPDKDFITEYEWDFGDGVKGYGQVVTHTYKTVSPSVRSRLCITDNHGRRFCVGRPMNLYTADLSVVGGFALINPPVVLFGNTTSGSTSITNLGNTSQVSPTMKISGSGIPTGATVTVVNSSTAITISLPATITATNVELVFAP